MRPNILMIAIDNVRADRMSAYGNQRLTTQNLDALGRSGTSFLDCTAQAPYTPLSFASMFASIYAADLTSRERARGDREPLERAGLDSYHQTLPTEFRKAGYFTGAIIRGWFTEAFGLTQGFDWVAYKERDRPEVEEVVRTSIRWLQQWQQKRGDQPFFLFSYTVDVHYPFMAGRPADAHVFGGDPDGFNLDRDVITPFRRGELEASEAELENALTLYDEGLYWADQEIQPLLEELDRLGLAENTIVVFVSDHGEEFGEHCCLSHGQNNFQTSVQVPLIIRAPGFPADNVVTAPVMNIDVMPTLLDLAGIPIPETVKGISLVPSLRGEPQPELEHRPIFSEGAWTGFLGLVRTGEYSYLQDWEDRPFLYDLEADPQQTRNLAQDRPVLAQQLERLLMQHKRSGLATQLLLLHGGSVRLDGHANPVMEAEMFSNPLENAEEAPMLSEESIQQLKALGYLQ
jgi:arylsulfatase A-like enzyme